MGTIEIMPITEKPAIHCSTCGRSLLHETKDGSKINIMALMISLEMDGAEEVLAPYKETRYHFCYPCCLWALGVKPPNFFGRWGRWLLRQ